MDLLLFGNCIGADIIVVVRGYYILFGVTIAVYSCSYISFLCLFFLAFLNLYLFYTVFCFLNLWHHLCKFMFHKVLDILDWCSTGFSSSSKWRIFLDCYLVENSFGSVAFFAGWKGVIHYCYTLTSYYLLLFVFCYLCLFCYTCSWSMCCFCRGWNLQLGRVYLSFLQ